jgi:hypothetical protein
MNPRTSLLPVLGLFLGTSLAACGGRTSLGGRPEGGVRRDGGRVDTHRPQLDWSWRGDYSPPWPDLPQPWTPDLPQPWTPDLPKPWPWKPDLPKPKLDYKPGLDKGCVGFAEGTQLNGACCPGLQAFKLETGISICSSSCTPDDPSTPLVNEDSCPDPSKHTCGPTNPLLPSSQHLCVRRCTPQYGSNVCGGSLACHWKSTSYSGAIDEAVCVHQRCNSAKACPIFLSQSCTVNAAGQCASIPGTFCAEDERSLTGGTCALPGACESASGLCLPHASTGLGAIGAACKDERDCKSGMRCDRERSTVGEIHARGGYCTLEGCAFAKGMPQRSCPSGSVCQRLFPGGLCFKSCKLETASDCRGNPNDKHGDYDCYAWNNLSAGGAMIADAPTCEPADSYPCNFFGTSPLDCSYLGTTPGNPTGMSCRNRKTGAVLPQSSPAGLCLDTTASGPK